MEAGVFVFYDVFSILCAQKQVSPSKAAEDIGLSRPAVAKWKKGAMPGGATLDKVAEYFGVSVDCLLRNSKEETLDIISENFNVSKDHVLGKDNAGDSVTNTFYELYCQLCKEKGVTPTRAALEMGLSKALPTTWKNKGTTPRASQLNKISEYFGVSVDYLIGNTKEASEESSFEPTLNARDYRDIAKRLKETLDDLTNNSDGLMFDGEPLDDETKELLRISLQNQLEMTKLMAKKKYTPKKYQK